ncbi:MAG: branched-chain amino acid transaminase [Bdellovibrionales bacterium]|nr:branched-chain amino acid transaminase [Bdellovibrionales bacterium]
MEKTEWIWIDGDLVPWDEAQVHVLTHTMHYGGGAFEGIRAYKTERGPAIFRLEDHIDRLIYSAQAVAMKTTFDRDEICKAVVETVRKNGLSACYIRPIFFYGYGKMGINPIGAPVRLAIACWPWGKYLPHDAVDIKVSSYIRIHPKSTKADAKICGHYVNSMMAVLEVAGTKYHEALLLDYAGNIAEGPGENIFLVYGNTVKTPRTASILPGITRKTIIEILRSQGFTVEETDLSVEAACAAEEAFFTGTAAEVTPIRSIDDNVFGDGTPGAVSSKVKELYHGIVTGTNPDYEKYLTIVE